MGRCSSPAFAAAAVSVALVLVACSGKDRLNPGEAIGTFHVVGTLSASSCGDVPNPWEFDVRLRFEEETLYWVQGSAPISGEVALSRVELRAKDVITVRDADPKTKLPGCAVQREDIVAMTVSLADQTPASALRDTAAFSGTLAYRFTPTADSDCMDQTAAAGGGFAALPCDVSYAITGTKK